MKAKYVILFLLMVGIVFSQGFRKGHRGPRERMEQLEQIKLLEVLNLDEETSVRLISRRNDFKEQQKQIMDDRQSLIFRMEDALKKGKTQNEYDYKTAMAKLEVLEKQFVQQRMDFINSLKDILTTEQIAKFVVFESKFMEEVRDALFRHGRGPKGPPNNSDN